MKYDELHRQILRNGWKVLRQSGSHVVYKTGNRIYPVPYHGSKEVGKGLEMKIKKDMDLL